ncbi:hypothetical protein J2046_003254 [Rhizobium petrolearium]|nr:hypothetical protein [Neorhizobium petrolearium]
MDVDRLLQPATRFGKDGRYELLTLRTLSGFMPVMTKFAAHMHLTVTIHPAGCVAVLAR